MSFIESVINLAQGIAAHPLTRDRKVGAVLRVIDWQFRSRILKDVHIPWVCGQRLVLSRGMEGATGNVYFGLHEFSDMLFVLHFLRPGDLFVDVGANVGVYTVLAAGACCVKTIAIEPDLTALRALRYNIAINGLDPFVEVHDVAVGPGDGPVHFTVGLGARNRVTRDGSSTTKVRQRPLDDIVGLRSPTFIKIDVEGYETEALEGARKTLEKGDLKIAAVEWPHQPASDLLRSYGFTQLHYDPFARRLTPESCDFTPSNTLFVRDLAFVEQRVLTAPAIQVLGSTI
jgi:FkbM family methyltransferase